jgi:hypothetical protein
MTERYILNEKGEHVLCPDLFEWARFIEDIGARRLAFDKIGDVRISTVFLGIDHAFGFGPPVLWETIIFRGPAAGASQRYRSREEALAGHAEMVALARLRADREN